MRNLVLVVIILFLTGCRNNNTYTTKCTVNKVDGVVKSVKVTFPLKQSETDRVEFVVSSREEANNIIMSLESILSDLKMARDQFKNVEPSPE